MSLAQQRLDEARTQATEISGRISAAQTQQAQLEAEIAEAEAKIPMLRARATTPSACAIKAESSAPSSMAASM